MDDPYLFKSSRQTVGILTFAMPFLSLIPANVTVATLYTSLAVALIVVGYAVGIVVWIGSEFTHRWIHLWIAVAFTLLATFVAWGRMFATSSEPPGYLYDTSTMYRAVQQIKQSATHTP